MIKISRFTILLLSFIMLSGIIFANQIIEKDGKYGFNGIYTKLVPKSKFFSLFPMNDYESNHFKEKTVEYSIPCLYDKIEKTFDKNTIIVEKNKKKGVYSYEYLIIPPEFDDITLVDSLENIFILKKDGKMGIAYGNMQYILPIEYDYIKLDKIYQNGSSIRFNAQKDKQNFTCTYERYAEKHMTCWNQTEK